MVLSYGVAQMRLGLIAAQLARSGLPDASAKIRRKAEAAGRAGYEPTGRTVLKRIPATGHRGPPQDADTPPVISPVVDPAAQEAADARIGRESNDKLIGNGTAREYVRRAALKTDGRRDDAAETCLTDELAGKKIDAFIQNSENKRKNRRHETQRMKQPARY